MPSTSSSRAATSAKNQVIELLKADHRKAKKAFKDFEKLDPEQDAEHCQAIVEQTCGELMVHMRLEEECFYPATRAATHDDDKMDEAEVEHAACKSLVEQLRDMAPADQKWSARFTVLGEYISHHVKEEEGEMFPAVSSKKLDWQGLLDAMTSRRRELMGEELPQQAAAEEKEFDDARPTARRAKTPARSGRGVAERARASSENNDDE